MKIPQPLLDKIEAQLEEADGHSVIIRNTRGEVTVELSGKIYSSYRTMNDEYDREEQEDVDGKLRKLKDEGIL